MTDVEAPLHGLTNDEQVLHRIADELASRFYGIFAAETIERYVFESYTALARTSRVRTFLVPRTERFASDRLTALATAKGALEHTVPEVLFVCVQNSGRSQMAAALLKARAGNRVHVRSAGSAPAEHIEPHAVEVLRRRGLSIEKEFPKPLTDDVVRAADVIITMGCGDSCPLYAGKRYLDWSVSDPAGRSLEETEAIAREIQIRVDSLLDELLRAPMTNSTTKSATGTKPAVLFVCVKNGGKSQMAAALMIRRAGKVVSVESAGTKPGSAVNGLSAESLAELGVDISHNRPKNLSGDMVRSADVVVTLGREAHVDEVSGTRFENWDTDEPSERGIDGIERMRLVRDDIARRVDDLYERLISGLT